MSSSDATILVAIIAAVFSVVVAVYNALTTKQRAQEAAQNEIDAQKKDIDTRVRLARQEIESKLEELRQSQLGTILGERIRRYPELWQLCQEKLSDRRWYWNPGNAPTGWELDFWRSLSDWHQRNGAFLSEESYGAFCHLRKTVLEALKTPQEGEQAKDQLKTLDQAWANEWKEEINGDQVERNSLATSMKNDLGSYWQAALSVRVSQAGDGAAARRGEESENSTVAAEELDRCPPATGKPMPGPNPGEPRPV